MASNEGALPLILRPPARLHIPDSGASSSDLADAARAELNQGGNVPKSCAILLSGGIDSSTLAASLNSHEWESTAWFVDYGQPARHAERAASRAISSRFSIPWEQVDLRGLGIAVSGEIRGRNDLFVAACLAVSDAHAIAIGTHGESSYRDCSPPHAMAWQALLDAEYAGRRRLLAPFLTLSKAAIVALARDLDVPLELTHSCDAADTACGSCASCQERSSVVACP